jgi:hypothetical protein
LWIADEDDCKYNYRENRGGHYREAQENPEPRDACRPTDSGEAARVDETDRDAKPADDLQNVS